MANNSVDNKKSRYYAGGTTEEYLTRLGWWERYVFDKSRDDVIYTIEKKYDRRPDSLAYDVYGSPQTMWVILQYNNIIDVSTEFVEGATILLPTPHRVMTGMA